MTTPYFTITPGKTVITINRKTADVVYQLAQMLITDKITDLFISNYYDADEALSDFISAYEGRASEEDLPYTLEIID